MTFNKRPLVSVITPLFNASKFIPRLIISVQQQTYSNYEHIIVNDCSTDNSFDILKTMVHQKNKIKIINLKINKGVIYARNLAIASAKGRFLAFLDADDFWLPNKLSTQVEFMLRVKASISFTDYRSISEDGIYIGRRFSGFDRINYTKHHITRFIGCSTVMIDRQRIPNFKFPIIPFIYISEDFLAWSQVIKKIGPAFRCPHDLTRYSWTLNSRGRNRLNSVLSIWKIQRNIEKIQIMISLFYLVMFLFFSIHKYIRYKPMFKSFLIDKMISKKYLLRDKI